MYSRRSYRRIKNEFSPAMYKANTPNHTQRKGRILQQSPLFMQEVPTEMITRKTLEKMYRMLIEYKYIPRNYMSGGYNPIPILNDFSNDVLQAGLDLTPDDIHNLVNNKQWQTNNRVPHLPARSYYRCQVVSFYWRSKTGQQDMQYSIKWESNLMKVEGQINQADIVIKSLDTALGYNQTLAVNVFPIAANQLSCLQAYVVSGGRFAVRSVNKNTNDASIEDNPYYCFIDTKFRDSENDQMYGKFVFTGDFPDDVFFQLQFILIPVLN